MEVYYEHMLDEGKVTERDLSLLECFWFLYVCEAW